MSSLQYSMFYTLHVFSSCLTLFSLFAFICPFQTQEVAGTPASPLPLPTPSMDGFINLASLTNIISRWKCYSRTWTCLMNRRLIVWQPRASYLTELGWTWNVQYVSVYACLSSVTVCVCLRLLQCVGCDLCMASTRLRRTHNWRSSNVPSKRICKSASAWSWSLKHWSATAEHCPLRKQRATSCHFTESMWLQ